MEVSFWKDKNKSYQNKRLNKSFNVEEKKGCKEKHENPG